MRPYTPEAFFTDVDLIQALVASSQPVEAEPITEARLVRYAFGWSTESEEEQILDALTQSSFLRQDLIQIRRSLARTDARSSCVREFLDYAISAAAGALGAMESGLADWKSSFEGNLVVQHAQRVRADQLGSLPGGVAWVRSASEGESPDDMDGLLVETEVGAPAKISLSAEPTVHDGQLVLDLDFGPSFLREYSDQTLELAFSAGPLTIPLRAWRVSELPSDGRLSAPIPSSLTGPVPRAAIGLSLSSGA